MAFEQNLRCPKDTDVILYTEDTEDTEDTESGSPPTAAYIPETPQQCPKCGTYYYQWECVSSFEVEDK
jgi:hypothetical protein